MKIDIDIDDVMFEFITRFVDFTKDKGIWNACYDDMCSYEAWKFLGISEERFFELLCEYNESEYFEDVRFTEGVKDGVDFLNDRFDVCFITARLKAVYEKTKKCIFEKFDISEDRVFFSGNTFLDGVSKCEVCKRLGVGLIIEDNGIDSLKYVNNEVKVLLLDKPWNQGVEYERIFRRKGWSEILVKVEELKDE